MSRISINLLPIEVTQERIKDAKFYKVQTIGVGLILVLIFMASLTIALRILQAQRLKQTQVQLGSLQDRIVSSQDKQVALVSLKNRLTTINQYLGTSSTLTTSYKLLDSALIPDISVTSLVVDEVGQISLSAVVADSTTLNTLLTNLVSQDKTQGKISQVAVESLSRSREGIYRISLNIKTK